MASKINEAKDLLSSFVEEENKESSDMRDDKSSDIDKYMSEFYIGKRESEKFIIKVLFSFKDSFTPAEREELLKKYTELIKKEYEEDKNTKKYEEYELKEKKEEDYWADPGEYVDKNSEFYEKYKDKIENEDYLDPLDEMNYKRKRITNKESIKI